MRAPEFWSTDAFPAAALEPLGLLYAWATRNRLSSARPLRVGVPVICIGNLTAGGAGKTPVGLAVMDILHDLGVEAHFLSRGYGGRLDGPVRVEPTRHTAEDVGDEPLLLARSAPCWISKDRAEGAMAAVGAGAQAIVMDDGHQNPALYKDCSLVVVDGAYGFGNRRVIPAGPLREPIRRGLARATAVVRLGPDKTGVAAWIDKALPVFTGRLQPDASALALRGRRVVAFAGLGRPAKFFDTLREIGAIVVAERAFADHHPYSRMDILPILEEAAALDATPVTTEKDAVRLPAVQRDAVEIVTVGVAFDDAAPLRALLRRTVTTTDSAPEGAIDRP